MTRNSFDCKIGHITWRYDYVLHRSSLPLFTRSWDGQHGHFGCHHRRNRYRVRWLCSSRYSEKINREYYYVHDDRTKIASAVVVRSLGSSLIHEALFYFSINKLDFRISLQQSAALGYNDRSCRNSHLIEGFSLGENIARLNIYSHLCCIYRLSNNFVINSAL